MWFGDKNNKYKILSDNNYNYYNEYYAWKESKPLTISDIVDHIKILLKRDKERYSKIILDQLDEQEIQKYLRSKKLLKIKSKSK